MPQDIEEGQECQPQHDGIDYRGAHFPQLLAAFLPRPPGLPQPLAALLPLAPEESLLALGAAVWKHSEPASHRLEDVPPVRPAQPPPSTRGASPWSFPALLFGYGSCRRINIALPEISPKSSLSFTAVHATSSEFSDTSFNVTRP